MVSANKGCGRGLMGVVRVLRDDHTGRIRHVDSERLRRHLGAGQVVVVPPYAQSRAGLLNVDGDRAAASIAGALGALQLLILSNVGGLVSQLSR
jgi:acetylglutamate/LysW-gamma-L-alpha-aminoadipate kinase